MLSYDNLVGQTLADKYRLEELLGQGGMGAVYKARQLDLGRVVAVKVLRNELGADERELKRFRREAIAAASLGHRNVVQVTDLHVEPGSFAFLVMELIDGWSLQEVIIREGRLKPARVVSVAQQVLSALGAAHDADIVHRDVKPSNVMLVSYDGVGEVAKLLDFGLVKMLDGAGATKLTRTGVTLGTPAYMSPEQALGEPVDHRTDLFSVGVLIFESLAGGEHPYQFTDIPNLLGQLACRSPRSLAEVTTGLEPGLVAVVDRALCRVPDDRFQRAAEMSAALGRWSRGSLSPDAQPTMPVAAYELGGEPTGLAATIPAGVEGVEHVAVTVQARPVRPAAPKVRTTVVSQPERRRPRTVVSPPERRRPRLLIIVVTAVMVTLVAASLIAVAVVKLVAVFSRDGESVAEEASSNAPLKRSEGGTELGVGATGMPSAQKTTGSNLAKGSQVRSGLVRHELIGCVGTTRIELDSVIIEGGNRMAVAAGNSCQVYLSNCVLTGNVAVATSGDSMVSLRNCRVQGVFKAIHAGERSKVFVEGGSLKGSMGAATVMGRSELHLKGVQVEGPVKSFGKAKILRQK